MRIEFKASGEEKIDWKELNKIMKYLSKNWDVKFKAYLSDNWEIYATPKSTERTGREKWLNNKH